MSSSSSSSDSSPPPERKRKREEEDSDSDEDSSVDATEDAPEVPVLSHAELRRQKKKAKLAEKAEKTASKKRGPKESTTAPSQTKRQNSVWVGNLSFKTTAEALKGFFDGVGNITRIHMPMNAGKKGENKGFAYVDFETAEAKAAAISRSENPLIGRRLLIKDGGDFTGRPTETKEETDTNEKSKPLTGHSKTAQKILRAQKQPPVPTLFLGNLGFETTEKSIRELFEAHRDAPKKPNERDNTDSEKKEGEKDTWIRKIRMGTFEDTGNCKGFAFVDFTTMEHATAALINPKNHHLDGRKLVVEYASADAVRRGGGPRPKSADGYAPRRSGPRSIRVRAREERAEEEQIRTRQLDYGADVQMDEPPSTEAVVEQEKWARPKSQFSDTRGDPRTKSKAHRPRSKPGAALALAKRESVAIVPSQGTKIKF